MIYWVTWIKFLNTGAFTTKLIRFLTVLLFKHHILSYFEPKIVRSHCALDIAKLAVPFHPILICNISLFTVNLIHFFKRKSDFVLIHDHFHNNWMIHRFKRANDCRNIKIGWNGTASFAISSAQCERTINCYENDHELRQNRICVWKNVLNWQWIMKCYVLTLIMVTT
jgi:hypothetical protein